MSVDYKALFGDALFGTKPVELEPKDLLDPAGLSTPAQTVKLNPRAFLAMEAAVEAAAKHPIKREDPRLVHMREVAKLTYNAKVAAHAAMTSAIDAYREADRVNAQVFEDLNRLRREIEESEKDPHEDGGMSA